MFEVWQCSVFVNTVLLNLGFQYVLFCFKLKSHRPIFPVVIDNMEDITTPCTGISDSLFIFTERSPD